MEPGEGPLLQSEPPGVNTLRNAELENSDNPPTTEMLESCLPDKIEAAKPSCSVEEVMEIPDTRGSSPVSSRVPHASSEGFHENEPKSDACGFGAAGSSPLPRFLWGEQMSEFSEPLSCSSGMNGPSKPPRYGKGRTSNSSSSCSTEKFMSSFASLELKTETPAATILNGITELLRWGNRKPESVPNGTTSDIKPSLQDGGKLKSVSGSKLGLTEENDDDDALLAMFSAVANSHLAVQSQQKDEPDFTPAQKLAILRDLYHTKPLVFLERFWTVLCEEHLACFHHLCGNYEADFYCAEVRRAGVGKNRHTRVRNKRYAALQQLIRGGEYFSDEQMRSRDPLLYKQYIGQYLSPEELQALESCKKETSCSLSGVLLDSYQEDVIQQRLQVQQEQEEAAEEEEEEEDSISEDDEDKASDDDMDEWTPDQEEKAILREEFTSRMYQHFLDGKDRDFDYSEVDENPDFDNLDIVSRDEEERYFDEEEEEEANAMEAE